MVPFNEDEISIVEVEHHVTDEGYKQFLDCILLGKSPLIINDGLDTSVSKEFYILSISKCIKESISCFVSIAMKFWQI